MEKLQPSIAGMWKSIADHLLILERFEEELKKNLTNLDKRSIVRMWGEFGFEFPNYCRGHEDEEAILRYGWCVG